MPARLIICPYCGWRWSTFKTDEEFDRWPEACVKCGCPVTLFLIHELNPDKEVKSSSDESNPP